MVQLEPWAQERLAELAASSTSLWLPGLTGPRGTLERDRQKGRSPQLWGGQGLQRDHSWILKQHSLLEKHFIHQGLHRTQDARSGSPLCWEKGKEAALSGASPAL